MNIASNKKAGIRKTRGVFTYFIYKTQFMQTFKCEFEKGKTNSKRTSV